MDHSEIFGDVRGQKYKNRHMTAFWSQVENRRSYNIASVRPSVRTYVRAERIISGTTPRIFPKFGMKLGLNRGSNVTRSLFLIFAN